MTNSKIESLFNLISLFSKFETIWESSATFTMFKSIITSNLIASKSASCWKSFDSIEIMFEHSNKSNELKIIMNLCLESLKTANVKSITFQISMTRRFIFSNRLLNQIVTSDTSFSMIDTLNSLHLMINMRCIQHYQRNLFMRILSFMLSSSTVIILILHLLNSHHLLLLSRFVHLYLRQSINQFILKISMLVSFFYLHLFRINMLVLHHYLWSLHQSFEIRRQSMRITMNWHNLDSYKISSRNYRN